MSGSNTIVIETSDLGLGRQLTFEEKEIIRKLVIETVEGFAKAEQQTVSATLPVPPANCRQRLAAEGKNHPRSSCNACGEQVVGGRKWKECDAALALERLR